MYYELTILENKQLWDIIEQLQSKLLTLKRGIFKMDLNNITKRIKELEKNLDICPHCGEGLAPDMKEKICPDCEQPLFENGEEAELETLKQLKRGV